VTFQPRSIPFTAPSRLDAVARLAALLLAALIALAACGGGATPAPASPASSASPQASPAASADAAAIQALTAEIADQVAAIRELELKEPIDVEILDEAGLVDYVETAFAEDSPPEYVAAYDRLLTRLGLLPADDDLAEVYVELLSSQVLGLYDEETDRLYVVARDEGIGATEKVTFAHEIAHAIQDQHFDLGSVLPVARDDGDRALGARTLVEGDASAVMALWMVANLTPKEQLELLQDAQDPEQIALLERTPAILRDPLTFQYEQGLTFALGLQQTGGWADVDAAFARPPSSTEQVIHPEKYAADEAPVEVDLPAGLAARLGAGWTLAIEDTFGELQLRTWLQTAGGREPDASPDATAEGWGGDRIGYLAGPDGAEVVVMRTAWDDRASADRFQAAASRSLADALPDPGTLFRVSDLEVIVVVGSDGAVLDAAVTALGLPGAG
jgi:hypothetical protein